MEVLGFEYECVHRIWISQFFFSYIVEYRRVLKHMWFDLFLLNGVFCIFCLALDLASFGKGNGWDFDGMCLVQEMPLLKLKLVYMIIAHYIKVSYFELIFIVFPHLTSHRYGHILCISRTLVFYTIKALVMINLIFER